jgi:hypothetical protein
MRKRNIGYSFLCGTLVFVAVLLLLIQALGVPFWWAFGVGNTQDGLWIISVSPENPKVGENVTVQVAFAGNYVFILVDNATVTITRHGIQTLTIYTNNSGEASFAYPGDATVIRASNTATGQASHSLYVAIPKAPPTWVRNCLIAISGSIVSGLFAGIATFVLQKKSWTKRSLAHNLIAKSNSFLIPANLKQSVSNILI